MRVGFEEGGGSGSSSLAAELNIIWARATKTAARSSARSSTVCGHGIDKII